MSPARLLTALHRTTACVAAMAAIAFLHASPARAGEIYTSNCSYTGGYDHSYNRSYSGNWGNGRYGSTAWGNGSASGYVNGGCVGTRRELRNPYVIEVPKPKNEQEVAVAAERERLWKARCRPAIRQDQYGVPRYHYSAAGCEYGKYE